MPAPRAAADTPPLVKKLGKYRKTCNRILVGIITPLDCFPMQPLSFLLISFMLIILLAVLFHFRRAK